MTPKAKNIKENVMRLLSGLDPSETAEVMSEIVAEVMTANIAPHLDKAIDQLFNPVKETK